MSNLSLTSSITGEPACRNKVATRRWYVACVLDFSRAMSSSSASQLTSQTYAAKDWWQFPQAFQEKRQLAKTTEMLHMSFYLSPVLLLPHCWSTFLRTLEKNPINKHLPYTHRCTVLSRVACATFMVLCTNTAFTTLSTSSWTMSGAGERRDLQPVQFAKRTMGLYQHRRQIAKTVILCYRTV